MTTLAVLHATGDMRWLGPVVVVGGAAAVGVALWPDAGARLRNGVLVAMLALLLLAPASWAVQTLGHATSGTFPAGGPADAGMGGGPGGRGGPGGGGLGGPGSMGRARGFGMPPRGGVGGAPPSGGGMFGGDSQSLTEALAYVRTHGGGTIAVSSQQSAAGAIIAVDADVAGIGGFSGRESQVTIDWLANAVQSGEVRWVIADSGGGMPADGRTGSATATNAAQQVGTATSVSGLYDLQGKADALRALE